MNHPDIAPDVRRFVLTSIASVPHMEALILLRSTSPACWNARDLARRLYVAPAVATAVMADLAAAGLLQQSGDAGYYYQPPDAALAAIVDKLAGLYATQLVAITVLIHSKLDRKAQQFADAFNLRKDS